VLWLKIVDISNLKDSIDICELSSFVNNREITLCRKTKMGDELLSADTKAFF